MKVHHIGYIIKNMERAINLFGVLGYDVVAKPVLDTERKIFICFLKNGDTVIELIESASPYSVVSGMVKKYGASPYHICYEVSSLDEAVANLEIGGYIVTEKPMPAQALGGRRVVFMYHTQIGLIELLEE